MDVISVKLAESIEPNTFVTIGQNGVLKASGTNIIGILSNEGTYDTKTNKMEAESIGNVYVLGIQRVKTNESSLLHMGDYVVSNVDGYAIKSETGSGFKVTRVSGNYIDVLLR
ncbi:hypothetical protein [Methanococcus voltae]|uniref:Uncharacterized protein n=2 Tax=Methanococcus voltae TaxID=2188 RepID=A0A8J7UTQ6_METVO|nr:hypothetical protein [Methanococcus voltae]MBP2173021.1 hypothetical protein [Methanococcus voltae]MBP2201923.1 hypothetical protein [Methanococcus voltae]MCS3922087.1 hypothetical protein [Methanococcus voltae PS]